MKSYTVDLDVMKEILRCRGVSVVTWRVSASKNGFHLTWICNHDRCNRCDSMRKKFDDPNRQLMEAKRKPHQRNNLWDAKGGRKAGAWHVAKLQK